jgi:hypothetical protein
MLRKAAGVLHVRRLPAAMLNACSMIWLATPFGASPSTVHVSRCFMRSKHSSLGVRGRPFDMST